MHNNRTILFLLKQVNNGKCITAVRCSFGNHPLHGFVHIFCLQRFSSIFESTVHIFCLFLSLPKAQLTTDCSDL